MTVTLYEKALDQVALRYAQAIRANRIEITPTELAAIVEHNWPKIVAEAISIYNQAPTEHSQRTCNNLQPAA